MAIKLVCSIVASAQCIIVPVPHTVFAVAANYVTKHIGDTIIELCD